MYGYIVPDKPNLLMKDFALYRAYYCGICKHTGKLFGQLPRFCTNYDAVLLAALSFDTGDSVPEVKKQVCVLNPLRKKPVVQACDMLDRICAANIILTYYKVSDDVFDRSGGGKKMFRGLLKRAYKNAQKILPDMDAQVKAAQERLRGHEKAGETSLDITADCSGAMLVSAVKAVNGDICEPLNRLAYNLGKWVYFADALDDFEEDIAKKTYNPLVARFGVFEGRQQLLEKNGEEIEFAFNACLNTATAALKELKSGFSGRLIDNIVMKGIRLKTAQLLHSEVKLPKPKI